VHELSARAVWIYPMRLSVTLGFLVLYHAYRPHRGLASSSFSHGRAFAIELLSLRSTPFGAAFGWLSPFGRLFRAEFLAEPALSFTTVVVTFSVQYLSIDKFIPMPGTRGTHRRASVFGGLNGR